MIHVDVNGFALVMEVLGLVIGIVSAFIIFFGFMPKKNEKRFSGWLGRLYDFLNFKFYIIEGLLKFCYVLMACICTGMGLLMSLSIVGLTQGLIILVVGNLTVRIAYEFILMLITACRNLAEINRKKQEPAPEEDKMIPAVAGKSEAPTNGGVLLPTPAPAAAAEPYQTGAAEVAASQELGYKKCPGCGEKCSTKFEFCNICGTKLP